jgi:hypothetical protein
VVAKNAWHHALERVAQPMCLGVSPPGAEALGTIARPHSIKVSTEEDLAHARVSIGGTVLGIKRRSHHKVARVLLRHGKAACLCFTCGVSREAGPLRLVVKLG